MAMQAKRHAWHDAADQATRDGLSPTDAWKRVAETFPHVSRAMVSGYVVRERGKVLADTPAVALWEEAKARAVAEIETTAERYRALYDWLRPVELPAPGRPTVTETPNAYTMVMGDFHFPNHDERTCAVFLQAVAALRPRQVILNGDTVDLLAVSRYPKDARAQFQWTLRDEVHAFHAFLRDLHGIGDAWGMEVVETEANHSGNGTASRWWRYLSDRCPELLGHDDAESILAYERWFFPKWSTITLVPEVVIADDLLILHGDMVRGKGGYTARAHQEKWMSSTLNSHTHRMGSTVRRVPARGSRPEGILRSYEIGCACNLEPVYTRVPDWTNGFAVIAHAAESYGVELCNVVNGRASVAAIGASLAA